LVFVDNVIFLVHMHNNFWLILSIALHTLMPVIAKALCKELTIGITLSCGNAVFSIIETCYFIFFNVIPVNNIALSTCSE